MSTLFKIIENNYRNIKAITKTISVKLYNKMYISKTYIEISYRNRKQLSTETIKVSCTTKCV